MVLVIIWFSLNHFVYFFPATVKQGILTLRLKTTEVVYVSFFEPAQLASVCKFQLWLWPWEDEDAKPIFWFQLHSIYPMGLEKSSMSIIFTHGYSFSLLLALQHPKPDCSLGIEFSRQSSFLSKNVKLFFFSLTQQCLIFHPSWNFTQVLELFLINGLLHHFVCLSLIFHDTLMKFINMKNTSLPSHHKRNYNRNFIKKGAL